MERHLTTTNSLQITALAIAVGLVIYTWRHRGMTGAIWFSLLMSAVGEWLLSNLLASAASDTDVQRFFLNLQYFGIVTVPIAWLGFTAHYTGRHKRLTPLVLALLCIVPLLVLACVWLNPEGLFRRSFEMLSRGTFVIERGPFFWLHAAYSYSLIFIATLQLLIATVRGPDLYRGQGIVLILAALVPVTGNALTIFGASPDLDLTPLSFTIGGLLMVLDLFVFRLFDVSPVALSKVMDKMSDALLVLDRHTHLVHLNPAAQHLLGVSDVYSRGRLLKEIWPHRPQAIDSHLEEQESRGEITLREGGEARYYELHASPITNERRRLEGWVIVLHDVTERKLAERTLRIQKEIFENLVAIARATSENLTVEETLQNTLQVTVSLTGAEVGNLLLLEEGDQLSHNILSLAGHEFHYDPQGATHALRKGLAGWVLEHQEVTLVTDTLEDERWIPMPGTTTFSARSVLSAPIFDQSKIAGVLTLTHTEPQRFTEDQVTLIRLAVDQIAAALHNAQLYDEQRQLTKRLTTLYEVLRKVGSYLERDAVVDAAVGALVHLAGWPAVGLLLPDEEERSLVLQAVAGEDLAPVGARVRIDAGLCGRAFRTGRTQYAPNVSVDSDYVSVSDKTRSELVVPLRRGAGVLGVLNIESSEEGAFSKEDIQLAESLGEAISLALDNARFHAEIRHYAEAVSTERSRLEAIIHSSRDGIVLVGTDRRTLVLNQAALALLGLDGEPHEWEKLSVMEMLDALEGEAPNSIPEVRAEIERVQEGNEPPGEGEWIIPPRTLHWFNLPVQAGEILLGRLFILRDVTQERILAQMRDELTHTLVHDLRSPLASISTAIQFLEMMLDSEMHQGHEQVLEIANIAAQRMLHMIDSILDLSSLESGKLPLRCLEFDLAPLIEETVHAHVPQIDEKELLVTTHLPDQLPHLYADAELVERILQNLLHNAIKFTPTGGRIRIDVRQEATDAERLVVSVQDSGPGIPDELRQRLFNKFATGQVEGRGSGLGLAFCRMAVEAHGGAIWVEETSQAGTTFSFTLPLTACTIPDAQPFDL
ncbi:MAG: histidine kinase N-terminal 7TM domain-containing protein [Anaerolineales bacterium]